MLPVFLIFALLLANLAQLQPGTAAQPLMTRISASLSLFSADLRATILRERMAGRGNCADARAFCVWTVGGSAGLAVADGTVQMVGVRNEHLRLVLDSGFVLAS